MAARDLPFGLGAEILVPSTAAMLDGISERSQI
jgi:hypothetical protein